VYQQGHVPYAPHLHNPQFLNENILKERQAGIMLGLEILKKADEMWMFGHLLSRGMKQEMETAQNLKIPIKYFSSDCKERTIKKLWQIKTGGSDN